jgi:1-acyl-sn-glycerol-3-phosphate acyltransferase
MTALLSKLNTQRSLGKRYVPISRQLWGGVYCIADTLLAPFFRVQTSGAHYIPSKNGFLLLPKHQYWHDIPLLGLAAARPLYYIAKYELFQYPLISRLLKSLGGIPLNRQKPIHTRWSFRAAVEVLVKGNGLVLFPEGTYFQNSMGDGRSGMLKFILNRVQVPLIPVGVEYSSTRRPQEVYIRFGAPIKPSLQSIRLEQVMDEIARLSGL